MALQPTNPLDNNLFQFVPNFGCHIQGCGGRPPSPSAYPDSPSLQYHAGETGNVLMRDLKDLMSVQSAPWVPGLDPCAPLESGPLPRFMHTALIDLQRGYNGSPMLPRDALRSILQQLGDTGVSVLHNSARLRDRLNRFVKDTAVLLVLLNVSSHEQYTSLVPEDMGRGGFVFITCSGHQDLVTDAAPGQLPDDQMSNWAPSGTSAVVAESLGLLTVSG